MAVERTLEAFLALVCAGLPPTAREEIVATLAPRLTLQQFVTDLTAEEFEDLIAGRHGKLAAAAQRLARRERARQAAPDGAGRVRLSARA